MRIYNYDFFTTKKMLIIVICAKFPEKEIIIYQFD